MANGGSARPAGSATYSTTRRSDQPLPAESSFYPAPLNQPVSTDTQINEAIDKQVKASEASKPLLIGETPSLEPEWDIEDVPVFDRKLLWGSETNSYEKQRLLNRYFAEQSDPGDEIND